MSQLLDNDVAGFLPDDFSFNSITTVVAPGACCRMARHYIMPTRIFDFLVEFSLG